MRDLYFFTNKKITANDCFKQLKTEIPEIKMNGQTDIIIDAESKSFIWFYNEQWDSFIFEDPKEFDLFKQKIELKDPYVTTFETHRSIDAKKVLKVLLKLYPELRVNVDDESDWIGTAQEYIDSEFDY